MVNLTAPVSSTTSVQIVELYAAAASASAVPNTSTRIGNVVSYDVCCDVSRLRLVKLFDDELISGYFPEVDYFCPQVSKRSDEYVFFLICSRASHLRL